MTLQLALRVSVRWVRVLTDRGVSSLKLHDIICNHEIRLISYGSNSSVGEEGYYVLAPPRTDFPHPLPPVVVIFFKPRKS